MTFASPIGTGPEPHSNHDEPETESPVRASTQRAVTLSVAACFFILTEKGILSPRSRSSAMVSPVKGESCTFETISATEGRLWGGNRGCDVGEVEHRST